ncbi:hypothetical protein HPB52_002580 [Rhipicephalus sanguineus]|uniref:Uncharacterized protein n=1 Tax=Rhipicephalus sanguineus TaxID=34632 RepID=A0A9D4QFX0_RHISA|nr:hypothetical protein HPB52_002580 [Rhipicephalus sanguineus]
MLAYMDKENRSVAQQGTQQQSGSFLDTFVTGHSRDLPILIGAAMGENYKYGSGEPEPQQQCIKTTTRKYGTEVGGTRPLSECGVHTVDVPYTQPSSAASLDGEVTLQVPSLSQCSSYCHRGLEDSYYNVYGSNDLTLKTRSLPSWGRAKQRPLSTEDDLSELYAKVNFSKRRKNRMRNDSAAAIAATRSFQNQQCYLSPFHTLPSAHTDTDSLVDNEAVVVYDERTAV